LVFYEILCNITQNLVKLKIEINNIPPCYIFSPDCNRKTQTFLGLTVRIGSDSEFKLSQNFSPKFIHNFLSNFAHRQVEVKNVKRKNAKGKRSTLSGTDASSNSRRVARWPLIAADSL